MSIGPMKSGTRALSKRYPVTDGIIAETTTQVGHQEWSTPQHSSLVPKRNKLGVEC
jgi:hypothetical protein